MLWLPKQSSIFGLFTLTFTSFLLTFTLTFMGFTLTFVVLGIILQLTFPLTFTSFRVLISIQVERQLPTFRNILIPTLPLLMSRLTFMIVRFITFLRTVYRSISSETIFTKNPLVYDFITYCSGWFALKTNPNNVYLLMELKETQSDRRNTKLRYSISRRKRN